MRHSLRYYRHSGPVIYRSKLPAPSFSMPCDYRILQSPTKGQVFLVLLETAQRSLVDYLLKKERLSKLVTFRKESLGKDYPTIGAYLGGT